MSLDSTAKRYQVLVFGGLVLTAAYLQASGISNLVARLSVAKVSNGIEGTSVEAVSTSAADAGNMFRSDGSGGQYIFNLSTKSLATGTWSLHTDLGDEVTHQVDVSLR